jgi:hypothetical protein
MTQPELKVELEELLARAKELEEPIPGMPTDNPLPPCDLALAEAAAKQLGLSADSMRLYLEAGERERLRLAESLINAAKAFEEYDEAAAEAITEDAPASAATPKQADEVDTSMLTDTETATGGAEDAYLSVRQAAMALREPDQGASFTQFSEQWTAYGLALEESLTRFRPFEDWEGESYAAVESSLEEHRQWTIQIAESCRKLAAQAPPVVEAHQVALAKHPTVEDAEFWEYSINWYNNTTPVPSRDLCMQKLGVKSLDDYYTNNYGGPDWAATGTRMMEEYAYLQQKSEETLAEYAENGNLPLQRVNPKKPPGAYRISAPSDEPLTDDGGDPLAKLSGEGLPTMPTMPTLPTMPSNMSTPEVPALSDAVLTGAAGGSPKLPAGGLGMKAASIGGGGGGVPSMPLQPPVAAESAGSAAGRGAPNLAGAGAGALAGGAAAGGRGGMGMAPMAGQGGKGQDSKAQRAQQDEEALYAEDRPWTEAVIGNRRRKDGPDNKESK